MTNQFRNFMAKSAKSDLITFLIAFPKHKNVLKINTDSMRILKNIISGAHFTYLHLSGGKSEESEITSCFRLS